MERNYINNEKSLIKMTKDKNQSNLKKKKKKLTQTGTRCFKQKCVCAKKQILTVQCNLQN